MPRANVILFFIIDSVFVLVPLPRLPTWRSILDETLDEKLGPNTWSTRGRFAVRIYTTDCDTQQTRQELEQAYKGLPVP